METDNVAVEKVEKEAKRDTDRAGLKVAAAAGVLGAVLAGLWGTGQLSGPTNPTEQAKPTEPARPVACTPPEPNDPQRTATLCAALNRPDLPTLLGTPTDPVVTARPIPNSFQWKPTAEVRLRHSAVALAEGYASIDEKFGMHSESTTKTTVLGHPAAIYTTGTFNFAPEHDENGKPVTVPGPDAQTLMVAQDPTDYLGPIFELAVIRQDGTGIDHETLTRLAETVLPTIPGWVAT
ncbi:DUF6215 domain-containing protein [Kitasatospora sp. NPDC056800]|uniref:DUF6215 domain-containing protein n=1 Tax=Kitasatospora sp. NPDC056800 TaxID=3345948 RepID=UPI0036AD4B57